MAYSTFWNQARPLGRVGRRLSVLLMLGVSILLSACSQPFFRTFDLDNGNSLSIDANQRLILVTEQGGIDGDDFIICAEPSPDALTARAAAIAASGGYSGISGSLAASSTEEAALIGLRTQTIQLLRDGYYRLCEAYLNGALSREQYNLALVNVPATIIAIMAVDAVAGTPTAPAVVVSAGGSSATGSTGEGTTEASASQEGQPTEITVNAQTAPALGEEAAGVLEAAILTAGESNFPALCMSYFSDPYFFDGGDEEQRAVSVGWRDDLLAHCRAELSEHLVRERERLTARLAALAR